MIQHPHRDYIEPISHPLYIVTVISNPQRYYTRYKHYLAFAKHMEESGVILYTVELILRDREYEITSSDNPRHIQLRCNSELWHKENLINIGISRLPQSAKYIGYFDADFLCTRPNWAYEALHMLQHYKFIQLFSTYQNLDKNLNPYGGIMYGFVKAFKDKINPINGIPQDIKNGSYWLKHGLGAPGGAWAFRREAFDEIGGLLDTCILGSGDLHMAIGLANIENYNHFDLNGGSNEYIKSIELWQDRCKRNIKGNIGYINNHLLHFYHGASVNRQYGSRSEILRKYSYDPCQDIQRDWQGVISWSGNKPALEEEVRQYFKRRNEDE